MHQPRNRWTVLMTSVVLGLLMCAVPERVAMAQDLADSLEEELLKGLGDDLLKPQEPADKPGETLPGGEQEPAGEDLGMGPEDDPLVRIGKRMRAVEQMIARREQFKQAPQRQQQIVKDLEQLIRQLRQQQQQNQQQASANNTPMGSERSKVQPPGQQDQQAGRDSGNSGNPSDRPARDSTERLGKDDAQQVDMAEMQSLLKDLWGHLPDRTREQMLQSSVEEFLPKYEVMIEKYFRRLAEDQQREEARP